ncbi:MAG: hypothetical protein IPJ37_12900 [Bacteroidales bacterium]|nr:hypothetical protein [Bacteroidales bacterium]
MDVFSDFIESNKQDKAERKQRDIPTVKTSHVPISESTKYTLTWDNIDVKFIDKLKKEGVRS